MSKLEKITALLKQNGLLDSYDRLVNHFASIDFRIGKSALKFKADFDEAMTSVYDNHLTQEEIAAWLGFWESEEGASIRKKMPLISQQSEIMFNAWLKQVFSDARGVEQSDNLFESMKIDSDSGGWD